MRELLAGFVPGPLRGGRPVDRRARRGHPAVRRRDDPDARRRRPAPRARRRAASSPSASSASSRSRTRCTPSSRRGWTALEPAERALVQDAAVLGQSFTPAGLARRVRPRRGGRSRRGCASSSKPDLLDRGARPALAGARPVRVRPGADPRGRVLDAVAQGPARPPPRGGPLLRVARRRRARRRARRALPRGLPGDARPATRPPPLAAQARLALRGAADRARRSAARGRRSPSSTRRSRSRRRTPSGPTCWSAIIESATDRRPITTARWRSRRGSGRSASRWATRRARRCAAALEGETLFSARQRDRAVQLASEALPTVRGHRRRPDVLRLARQHRRSRRPLTRDYDLALGDGRSGARRWPSAWAWPSWPRGCS